MFGDFLAPTHLLLIMLVALVVLGPKRLPEVGRSLGKGLRDFRSAMSGIEEETHDIFDSARVHVPAHSASERQPEPVMAAASSSPESSPAGTSEETPAVSPRVEETVQHGTTQDSPAVSPRVDSPS